jgi:Zn-dependent protease
VLAITVHVFGLIVFALLDGGRVTSWHPPTFKYNCESTFIRDANGDYG